MRDVVVVGGSIAGFVAASELRAAGYEGRLRIVGDESVRTYERAPALQGRARRRQGRRVRGVERRRR